MTAHEDTYRLPSAARRAHDLAALDPYARVDEDVTLPAAVYTTPPRPQQVGLALARIWSAVQLFEAEDRAPNLDTYLRKGHEANGGGYDGDDRGGYGHPNPLGALKQYRDFHDETVTAGAVLRVGGAS